MLKWVKLKKYCELSGETPNAIHIRRNRGIWLDGVQSRLGPDGNLWINIEAVEQWIEKGNITNHLASQSSRRKQNQLTRIEYD